MAPPRPEVHDHRGVPGRLDDTVQEVRLADVDHVSAVHLHHDINVTEWFAGKLARYDPLSRMWREWPLPGSTPQPYVVYVDEEDVVWTTDFGANALVRFDPRAERFRSFRFPTPGAEVRQLLGRTGEIWGAESATDRLVVLRTT